MNRLLCSATLKYRNFSNSGDELIRKGRDYLGKQANERSTMKYEHRPINQQEMWSVQDNLPWRVLPSCCTMIRQHRNGKPHTLAQL